MVNEATQLPRLFEMLRTDPANGLDSLIEYLSRTQRWFVENGKVYYQPEDSNRLIELRNESHVKTLTASAEIPVFDPHGRWPRMSELAKNSIPTIIHGYLVDNAVDRFPTIQRRLCLPMVKIVKGQLEPCTPGWDATEGVYYTGSTVDTFGVSKEFPFIRGWLEGLCFGNDYHKANVIGITAAMFARSTLKEFPSIFIDANTQSSGKTKLAKAMGAVLTGKCPMSLGYTGDQDESEKRLSPFAEQPGPHYILIDNVIRKGKQSSVTSQFLARSLDGDVVGFRAFYKGQVALYSPIFVLTMNDTTVHSDLQDKSVRIRVERHCREPNQELSPDPLTYALVHNTELRKEFMELLIGLPVHANNHDTRCYLFNSIVYGVADRLGLKASLHSRDVACPSDIVSELVFFTQENDTHAELGREFDLQRLVDQVAARPDDYKELNRFLRQCQRPHKQRGKELGKHLFHNAARPFLFEDAMYKLDVDAQFEKATLQKISPSA